MLISAPRRFPEFRHPGVLKNGKGIIKKNEEKAQEKTFFLAKDASNYFGCFSARCAIFSQRLPAKVSR